MPGKASLILVVGLIGLFVTTGLIWSSLSTRSVDNEVDYYSRTTAHNIAVSGANLALTELFRDTKWNDGFKPTPVDDGLFAVSVTEPDSITKIIKSKGIFNGFTQTVIVKLRRSTYTKFAWYINNSSSKTFITGDTIWGPLHSQSTLNIAGDPVFVGKVTTLKGLNPKDILTGKSKFKPQFLGGYQDGVDIPIPPNYEFSVQRDAAIDGVNNKGGSSYFEGTDVWLTFNIDGTITYRVGTGNDSSKYSAPTTESIKSFAPNGVVYVKKGDIYMSGQVNGQIIVASGEASGIGNGNIYLTDNITYSKPPVLWDNLSNSWLPNYDCTDMLGILATNNVMIATNKPSGGYQNNVVNKNIYVDGAIFCAQGGFQTENLNFIPPSGKLYLRGGMIANKEESLAITDGFGTLTNGFHRNVIFDQRFLLPLPPQMPLTGNYEIISWLE